MGHRKRSTGTSDRKRAEKFLARWKAEIDGGSWLPGADRLRYEEMVELLVNDYTTNQRRSLPRVQIALAHLKPVFEGTKASAITTDRIVKYTRDRQAEGAASASVNRELAALKRMFSLAVRARKIPLKPHIPMLTENNARKGFFEAADLRRLLEHLPEAIRPVAEVAYLTGWRVADELLTRQWKHIDFGADWLRLEPGETKNGEGRMFPLFPQLRTVLEQQREHTHAVERETGRIIPWVFHRDGAPIKTYRRGWVTACLAAASRKWSP